MREFLVHDTLEAFLKTNDGDLYFFGMTTNSSITKAVEQELIRAGIGNKVVAVRSSNNEMSFSITTGLHYNEVYEIQSGQKFAESSDIEIFDVSVGEDGEVVATPKTVSGDVIEFKADSFPKNHYVQLRTIVYDPKTNDVVADLYFVFDNALPDGALSETFEAANKTTEINFTALTDEEGNYCKCIIVPKDQGSEI